MDSTSKQKRFLIYIVNQEVEFDEEPVTITFFKDITFGVLYSQIIAQDELQSIITRNLDTKIGNKLDKISVNVQSLIHDKSLKKFEEDYPNTNNIRKQLDSLRILTNTVLLSI